MQQMVSRRTFLTAMMAGSASMGLLGCGSASRNRQVTTPSKTGATADFLNPLVIPPLVSSTRQGNQRLFELVAQEGSSEILPGVQTVTWGYNGALLGPTLRARRGEEVVINFRNRLSETTTLHWHGMHLPAAMDGGIHQPVEPGASWQPQWQIKQPAATLWYHPHPHGATERHVYRGLAGLFILDDDERDRLALPSEYGINDVPLIIQDKRFNRAGELSIGGYEEPGLLGDTILVNGTYAPFFDVSTTLLRLRILNGSTARIYNFGFDDQRTFRLIGSDGGLLNAPLTMTHIQLSPGERAEIVVEFQPNSQARLQSFPADLKLAAGAMGDFGNEETFDILQLRAGARLTPIPAIPSQLAQFARLNPADAIRTRDFTLNGRQINGQRMEMDQAEMHQFDQVVTVNTTEVWNVYNQNPFPHNFHIHDVQFQVLTIDGVAPPAELAGWKDTVYLQSRTRYQLIMHFADYADAHTPYMYHCHLLWHEDSGMMGQFIVVDEK